jgi:hypothetical protein
VDRSIKVPQPLQGKIGLIGPGALGALSGEAQGPEVLTERTPPGNPNLFTIR